MSIKPRKRRGSKVSRRFLRSLDRYLRVHQEALLEVGEESYACRVHDYDNERITLSAPLDEEGYPLLIAKGTTARVVLRSGLRFLGFETSVQPRVIEGIPVVVVFRPVAGELTDRREYFRVPVDLDMEFELDGTLHTATAIDLSGGGILCRTPRDFAAEIGSGLTLHIPLPDAAEPLKTEATLRRLSSPRPLATCRHAAFQFVNLAESQRERLISYVTQQQLELIRKGVLNAAGDEQRD